MLTLNIALSIVQRCAMADVPVAGASKTQVWSILGKNLKANTAQELEPYLSDLKNLDNVEEVHLGGNSLGVEACQAIAEILKVKMVLKVSNVETCPPLLEADYR